MYDIFIQGILLCLIPLIGEVLSSLTNCNAFIVPNILANNFNIMTKLKFISRKGHEGR